MNLQIILTIIGSLVSGGALVKLIDLKWISKKDMATLKLDEATKLRQEAADFRKELREEVDYLKTKLKTIQKEVDEWREKYYRLLTEHTELTIKYQLLKSEQDKQYRENQIIEN